MDDEAGIAVLIPTLNEAGRIGALLEVLGRMEFAEIIVADGGSSDTTPAIVRSVPGVVCIAAPRGRGTQLKAAVAQSTAPLLFMLHADTLPPHDAVEQIRRALRMPRVIGGCFRLRFDVRSPLLDFFAWLARFETCLTTFGDQGFFVRRRDLDAIGGIPAWSLLEDVELRARLVRAGTFVKVRSEVVTSARRFMARGTLRAQLRNTLIMAGYFAGVPIEKLSKLYGTHEPG